MNNQESIFLYVAGPYTTTDPVENTHKAINLCNELREDGYVPFCPHLMLLWHAICPQPYRFWLDYDKQWLTKCDVLFRMPGVSSGADEEVELARSLNIPVVYSKEELRETFPPTLKEAERVALEQYRNGDYKTAEELLEKTKAENVGTLEQPPTEGKRVIYDTKTTESVSDMTRNRPTSMVHRRPIRYYWKGAEEEEAVTECDAKDNKNVTLPTIAIVGHAGCGKDEAAKWLVKNTPLRYELSTSEWYWAQAKGQHLFSLQVAKQSKEGRQQLAADIAAYNASDNGTRLYSEMKEVGYSIIVGIRIWDELRRCLDKGLVNEVLWIDADVPEDVTLNFGLHDLDEYGVAHSVVENDFGPIFFRRLSIWSRDHNIPLLNAISGLI